MPDLLSILEKATSIAQDAGALLREGWGNVSQIEYKGEVDLVTQYDTRAESLIIEALQRNFGEHAIHTEEEGQIGNGSNPYRWLIDPLDGTTNYAHGFPVFSVSLALTHRTDEGRYAPIVGVIYDPIGDECFTAVKGDGAHLNGRRIQSSDVPTLDEALLSTGFPYDRRTRPHNNTGHFAQFIRRSQGVRRAGSAALDLSYVACGRLEGHWEIDLHPWDVAAGILVVQEAGGRVSDFEGGPDYLSGERIVASNGHIHDQMLEVLALGDVPVAPSQKATKK
jgi:myo-inositol-1(or 4)-monophosphatase